MSRSPFPPQTDFYTKHGAGLLADFLTEYWHARGYRLVRFDRFQLYPGAWGVRSNLVNGLPRFR